jgi:hypothetical protein
MPFTPKVKWFLTAAPAHLSVAAVLLVLTPATQALSERWDLLLWLLLVGFVSGTTAGLTLHLFPPVAHRVRPKGPWEELVFLLYEAGVVAGALALWGSGSGDGPSLLFLLAAGLWTAGMAGVLGLLVLTVRRPRIHAPGESERPGDAVSVPTFLGAWAATVGAGVLFALSALAAGPGFGWRVAAVHLFVLGHAGLLIAGVSLRLVPRSLGANPPRWGALGVAGLGGAGATLVPLGMLATAPSQAGGLALFAAPEAAFAVLLVGVLVSLGMRATTPRPHLALHLAGATLFVAAGGIALAMVVRSSYAAVVSHAFVGVMGFVGTTILLMWFLLLAPFQRISHAWTKRMLWSLSATWLAALVALAIAGADPGAAGRASSVGGGLLLVTAVAWEIGTVPVLFPSLNPLPGLTVDEIRTIRDRWGPR